MGETIEVLIADDHPVVRAGISLLLMGAEDITVLGEASDGREAVDMTRLLKPDVVLMDLMMPRMNGVEAIGELQASHPDVRVVILTGSGADAMVFTAIRAGAVGYLTKDAGSGAILRAIRQVHRGELALDPAITRKLLRSPPPETPLPGATPSPESPAAAAQAESRPKLTRRQIEILRWLAKDLSSQQIATRIAVSESTVRSHISHILASLGLASRTDLLRALRQAHRGEPSPLPRSVVEQLESPAASAPPLSPPSITLTQREIEVAAWLARGLGNQQIGERLCISEATVRTHVSHLLKKLGLANRVEAALYALRQGWAELE